MSSAAYRIAFTSSAAFALAILLLGIAVYFAADADFRHQQDAGLAEETSGLLREYGEGGLTDLRRAIAKRESGHALSVYGYALFDRGGARIGGTLATPRPMTGSRDIIFNDPREGADEARALATDLPEGVRLVVARDTEGIERIDATILALFAGAFLLVIVLGAAGAVILGAYLRRRLGRISSAAQAIMAGDLARRVPIGARDDEFDQLALSLNAMLERIGQLLGNLRQVSSDVAHDLRTPLARLRNQLEDALRAPDTAASRAGLKQAIGQSDHLLALFAAILRIAEVEAGALRQTFAPIDLSTLAGELYESYAPAVADHGRTLDCAIARGLALAGNRELLAQALINLLDNAQHHTPAGTRIMVRAIASGDRIDVSVADDGPGVAAADRAIILHRFARLDASRATPGHGLGLSLVAAIVAAHGGSLAIEDNLPGLRVTLSLPRLAA